MYYFQIGLLWILLIFWTRIVSATRRLGWDLQLIAIERQKMSWQNQMRRFNGKINATKRFFFHAMGCTSLLNMQFFLTLFKRGGGESNPCWKIHQEMVRYNIFLRYYKKWLPKKLGIPDPPPYFQKNPKFYHFFGGLPKNLDKKARHQQIVQLWALVIT